MSNTVVLKPSHSCCRVRPLNVIKVIASIPQKSYGDANNDEDKKSAKIEPQEAVLINFEGRVAADRTVRDGPLFQEENGWLIVVGNCDVVPALEMVRKFPGLSSVLVLFVHAILVILAALSTGNTFYGSWSNSADMVSQNWNKLLD